MDLGLTGRSALVTGGSGGIGKSVAQLLAKEGCDVAITYYQNRHSADINVDEIRRTGGKAYSVYLDLKSDSSIHSAVQTVVDRSGHIDILINNAVTWDLGRLARPKPFEECSTEDWRPVLSSNIQGTCAVVQTVLPYMKQKSWGRIVSVSSTLAEDGMPGTAWYAASKAALHGLTRSLSTELGPSGILINVVMLGLTNTKMVEDNILPQVRAMLARRSPIRRLLTPNEVAMPIVFLSSGCNTSITGQLIRVSGGM